MIMIIIITNVPFCVLQVLLLFSLNIFLYYYFFFTIIHGFDWEFFFNAYGTSSLLFPCPILAFISVSFFSWFRYFLCFRCVYLFYLFWRGILFYLFYFPFPSM